MKWIDRMSVAVRAQWTQIKTQVENPQRVIHQTLLDMEEEIERVREHIAEAIADEIELGRKVEKIQKDVELYQERASRAVAQGDDMAAQDAMGARIECEEKRDSWKTELEDQKRQTAELEETLRDLDERLRKARGRKSILLARMTRAEARSKLDSALEGSGRDSVGARFDQFEEQTERLEAKCEARERLRGRSESLRRREREWDRKEREEKLREELDALKRKTKSPSDDA